MTWSSAPHYYSQYFLMKLKFTCLFDLNVNVMQSKTLHQKYTLKTCLQLINTGIYGKSVLKVVLLRRAVNFCPAKKWTIVFSYRYILTCITSQRYHLGVFESLQLPRRVTTAGWDSQSTVKASSKGRDWREGKWVYQELGKRLRSLQIVTLSRTWDPEKS